MKEFKNDKMLSLFIIFLYKKGYYIEGYNHESLFLKNIKKIKNRTDIHSYVFRVFEKNSKRKASIGNIFIKINMKKETNFLCQHGAILDNNNKNVFNKFLEEVEFLDNIQHWG